MLEVLYSFLLYVWHGASVYMPFVSFLSVYQSGEKRGREDDIYISLLLARLNDGGTDGFYRPYRPLLVRVIENDDEDEV